MSELDIKVTKIGRRWHARLLKGEVVLDEMYPFDPVEDNPWSEEDLKALKNQ